MHIVRENVQFCWKLAINVLFLNVGLTRLARLSLVVKYEKSVSKALKGIVSEVGTQIYDSLACLTGPADVLVVETVIYVFINSTFQNYR